MAISSNERVEFLETLHSKVMATIADRLGLLCFLTHFRCTKETAMASFLLKLCKDRALLLINRLTRDY